jgi:hypothetical protein
VRDWWNRRRERRRAKARINNNPPLPGVYEVEAGKLARLVLAAAPADVRAIGVRLNVAGGVPLMRYVAHRADALSLEHGSGPILDRIDQVWGSIGDWGRMGHAQRPSRRRDPAA